MSADPTADLRALLAEATPGPWDATGNVGFQTIGELILNLTDEKHRGTRADLNLIAALRNNAEALLDAAAERDALRAENERLREALHAIARFHQPEPATEGMTRRLCVLCDVADGRWPCVTRMEVDAALDAVRRMPDWRPT